MTAWFGMFDSTGCRICALYFSITQSWSGWTRSQRTMLPTRSECRLFAFLPARIRRTRMPRNLLAIVRCSAGLTVARAVALRGAPDMGASNAGTLLRQRKSLR